MNITELSVKRPTAIAVIFIILIGLGIMGFTRLGADLFPKADTPVVSVRVLYPGSGAAEIEKDVIKPIEDSASGLAGIEKVRSVSGEGFGYVILQFSMASKTDRALMDVQKAVDAMADELPANAGKPVVRAFDINAQPILALSVSGLLPYEELRAGAEELRKRLENVPGVGLVSLLGAEQREVDIVVDRTALEAWGLDLGTVIAFLRANNLTVPSGLMRQDGVSRPVRVLGEFTSLEELRAFHLPLAGGGSVALGEIASVALAYLPDARRVRMDGNAAIGLLVVKASDANVVETADRVKLALATASLALPPGMEARIASDSTIFITESISETERDLILGIIVTSAVLFLFLRKWRSSLIVLVAIPTSLVSTFFMMYMMGFTLNVVSVMALALCIGILVDDSIVVLENIHRHHQLGVAPREAAIRGRMEISMAAIAITLCDVVVFAPVAFMSDMVGQFFRQFGLTVVFATLFSLLVSFTITPALASRFLASEARAGERAAAKAAARRGLGRWRKGGSAGDKGFFEVQVKGAYRVLLERALAHRGLVLAGLLFLVAGSVALLPLGAIQTEFLPPFDQGKLVLDLNLGAGASLDRTDGAVALVEAHLGSIPEVVDVFSQIGTEAGPNYANLVVRLRDKADRKRSQSSLARELRAWAAAEVAGVQVQVKEEAIVSQTSVEGSKPFILNITGPDRQVLQGLAEKAEAIVRATPGAVDVQNSNRARQTEISVTVDRLALTEYGLQASDVATVLRAAFAGAKAGVYRQAGEEYDMIVKFSPREARSPLDLAQIRLRSPAGALVTLGQLARISRDDSPSTLERSGRSPVMAVSANLQGRALGAVTKDVEQGLRAVALPPGYAFHLVGDSSNMTGSFGSLAWALVASVLLVYLVLVVLYESWLTPLIRLLSLPAGIIGGLGAMALTGKAINIISFIGIIMLDGLVSKNGTLLIDYTNTLIKRGHTMHEALVESGMTRLRPILMTSATMIVGMLPLALSSGASSEIKSGMAVVLIGGLLTSTLISPFLIPVVYTLIDDARARRQARATKEPSP